MISFTSLLGCQFCHSSPFYVIDSNGRIYYVVHRFQSMSRVTIHLGVHNHLVVDESVGSLLRRLKGWSQRRWIARLMQKSLRFPLMLTWPSWWITCLMILGMAQWSSSKVSKWSKSRTNSMHLAHPMFIILLLLWSVIQEVAILIAYLDWNLRVNMTTSGTATS